MSSDKELLELAAKAAGITIVWQETEGEGFFHEPGFFYIPAPPPFNRRSRDGGEIWNPLEFDEHALRLSVKLHLTIDHYPGTKEVCVHPPYEDTNIGHSWYEDEPYEATRRAIVRAAAAMASRAG